MVSQVIGALVRAVLVAMLIATPATVLPGVSRDGQELALVFALIGAAVTLMEYGASHPGLVEFRFAPPFNRVRFLSIYLTVLLLAVMFRADLGGAEMAETIRAIGGRIGRAMDFAFSPVNIVTTMLGQNASHDDRILITSAAGIAYVVSLSMLAIFAIAIRVLHWPLAHGAFNLWINLPTFDWSYAEDVEQRLIRDARVNVIYGFTLPFLIPLVAASLGGFYEPDFDNDRQTLIWLLAIWAFLPASLFMRGIAFARIATLIRRKRQRLVEASVGDFAAA